MGIDDIVRKAKEAATDERIDQAAAQLRKITPDDVDRHVDTAAEHAKKYNEDEPAPARDAGARRTPDESRPAEPAERAVRSDTAGPGVEIPTPRETGRP